MFSCLVKPSLRLSTILTLDTGEPLMLYLFYFLLLFLGQGDIVLTMTNETDERIKHLDSVQCAQQ